MGPPQNKQVNSYKPEAFNDIFKNIGSRLGNMNQEKLFNLIEKKGKPSSEGSFWINEDAFETILRELNVKLTHDERSQW